MKRGSRDYVAFSIFSALLHGRLTGSGALFGGADSNSGLQDIAASTGQAAVDAAKKLITDAAAKAKADAAAIAAQAAQATVNSVSPGSVIVTQNSLLIGAAALVAAVVVFKKE